MSVVATCCDPSQQVIRFSGMSRSLTIDSNRKSVYYMLDAVPDAVCSDMQLVKKADCDGVLYSINGTIVPKGKRRADAATFNIFLKPPRKKVLVLARPHQRTASPSEQISRGLGRLARLIVTCCLYSVFAPALRITLAQRTASDF